MAFADSFVPAYHFRLLYMSSAMVFPIMGALRKAYGSDWQVRHRCLHQHLKRGSARTNRPSCLLLPIGS